VPYEKQQQGGRTQQCGLNRTSTKQEQAGFKGDIWHPGHQEAAEKDRKPCKKDGAPWGWNVH
jgi:hypothetical protein